MRRQSGCTGLVPLFKENAGSRPASSRGHAGAQGGKAPGTGATAGAGGPGWETIELGAAPPPPRSPLHERGNRLPDSHPKHDPGSKPSRAERAVSTGSAVTAAGPGGGAPWEGAGGRRGEGLGSGQGLGEGALLQGLRASAEHEPKVCPGQRVSAVT